MSKRKRFIQSILNEGTGLSDLHHTVEVDEKGGIDDHITATGYPYPEDKHHPLGVRKKER